MIYVCEECGKETEAEPNKFSRWIKCECGFRAFEKGFDPNAEQSPPGCRGGL